MSLLANVINQADYPLYRVNVQLSTNQQFQYVMIFNSGLPQAADDGAVLACCQALKAFDWGTVAGNPPGTTATSVQVVRATEQTSTRTI